MNPHTQQHITRTYGQQHLMIIQAAHEQLMVMSTERIHTRAHQKLMSTTTSVATHEHIDTQQLMSTAAHEHTRT